MPQYSHNLSPELIEFMKTHNDDILHQMQVVDNTKEIQEILEETNKMEKNTFSYDMNCPIPGQAVDMNQVVTQYNDIDTLKENAEKTLITTAALHKLKKEQSAERKRPLDIRVKEFYINSIINKQKNDYFVNNGYNMSGKQIRQFKRMVESKYAKGQIKPTAKEYEDIVAYLNSPLNDPNNKKVNPMKAEQSTSQQIGSLMSMI